MATEPATINLDDIFGAIPNLEASTHVDVAPTRHDSFHHRTESVHRADSHAGSHHVSHVSSAVYASHVSSGYTPTPESVLDVYIPPEPRTRASTAQHSSQVPRSQATSVSTVRNEHSHVPVSHVMVHPVPAPREPSYAPSDNGLMDSIFGVVSLPEVQYNSSAPSSHVSHHHHHHNNVHHGDHHVAIQHIDDALAGEDTDGHSVASEQSYRAPSQASKHSQYSAHHGAHIVANNVVNDSFNALNLNGSANGHHELYEYQDEIHDRFEPAHLPYPQVKEQGHRPRALTLDSMASAAETRYGGFDVHDDHDHYTGQEIDLHHNEVAYNRPKKIAVKSQPIAPMQSSAPYSGGTYKLQQLNREVADAHKKQAQLAAQIERMEVENERRRQQNLAKEAQLKVENRFGYNQRSSSVTSQSSTGHVGSGHRHSSSSAVPLSSHISHQNGHHNHSRSSTVTTTVTPAKLVSQTSIYEEEPTTISEVAQYQISHGHSLGRVGKFNLVVPHMETVQGYSKNTKIHKVVIGGHSLPTEDDKCVLLFGPVGSGKTSTLNSMLNYLYDVKKENDFRFVLDHDHKKTVGLTAYVINNSILPFSVTVIDTPGVIDEKGNKTVSNLIKAWFEQELFDAGAFRLDAISIVLKHDEDNLGWPFIYELATVKRMFGDDLKTNVLPIITHTEPLPQPLAIRSLALANIAFVEYYKVNNIGFVPEAKGITKLQHNLFFTHGMASLERFFRGLQELIHPLLAVLRSPAGLRSVQSHSYEGTALY